jgi:hypothetical protein
VDERSLKKLQKILRMHDIEVGSSEEKGANKDYLSESEEAQHVLTNPPEQGDELPTVEELPAEREKTAESGRFRYHPTVAAGLPSSINETKVFCYSISKHGENFDEKLSDWEIDIGMVDGDIRIKDVALSSDWSMSFQRRELPAAFESPKQVSRSNEVVKRETVETSANVVENVVKELPTANECPLSEHRHAEEQAFGRTKVGFPTSRRPVDYRRPFELNSNDKRFLKTDEWKENAQMIESMIGGLANTDNMKLTAQRLLFLWRDLFVTRIRDMPETDLVDHYIPTYPDRVPKFAKAGRVTVEEQAWVKKNFPALIEAQIFGPGDSPWCARTKWPRKRDGELRMVHNYVPINAATIKSNYPIRRIEPILQSLARRELKFLWSADAANAYWAVPIHPSDRYKTGFTSPLGQMCYNRMGMGLTGGVGTYCRLKDIAMGYVPSPNPEPPLAEVDPANAMMEFFMDDDCGGGTTFEATVRFLADHYFPRLKWANLTLNPNKSKFFVATLKMLGHMRQAGGGLRPSADKIAAIREYPEPESEEDLHRFLFMLPYLKAYIPGRADLSNTMKTAIITEPVEEKNSRKRRTIGFEWLPKHRAAFNIAKAAITNNVLSAGDSDMQYHLATDASNTGMGGYLFQLEGQPTGTRAAPELRKYEVPIMYMSFQFNTAQRNYHVTEREALAALTCLEECRPLIKGVAFPTMLYTDHSALLTVLKGDDTSGRIARWQIRLSEYDIECIHIPGKLNAIADGLSRIRGEPSYVIPSDREEVELLSMACETGGSQPSQTEQGDQNPAGDSSQQAGTGSAPVEISGTDRDSPATQFARNLAQEIDNEKREWQIWIDDPWYGDAVEYMISGHLEGGEPLSESWKKIVRKQAASLVLLGSDPPKLLYRERNGKHSICLHHSQVAAALHQLHDAHGHYAADIAYRKSIGKFYWPTRYKDILQYCRSCANCQFLGPLKPSQGLMPVLHLQPLDMMGIDFIGPFSPIALSGARYIIIAVDYATRFLWARAVRRATGANVVKFLKEDIVQIFGWPLAFYHDNGSHFAKGVLPEVLSERGIKQMLAPVSHPASVGLSEAFVKIVLSGLRGHVQGSTENLFIFDKFLPQVCNSANTRWIKTHGFTPAELMYGFNPRVEIGDETIDEAIRKELLGNFPAAGNSVTIPEDIPGIQVREEEYGKRLAKLEDMRDAAARLKLKQQMKMADGKTPKFKAPKVGDLVLLRRLSQDNQKSHKLEARWEGPYRIDKLQNNGRSARISDLKTDRDIGKYHLNDLKTFCERKEYTELAKDWKTVAELNNELRGKVLRHAKELASLRKEEKELKDKGLLPQVDLKLPTDQPDKPCHYPEAVRFPDVDNEDGPPDEGDPKYWDRKKVTLGSLMSLQDIARQGLDLLLQ